MTWKDILKQNIPTQREHGFPVVGDIYVYDPNIGDDEVLTFYSDDWDNGLEIRDRENSRFERDVVDKHPNSPLVAFFNKYAKFRRKGPKPDSRDEYDYPRIEMIKEPTAQEIKSVAESMGLKIRLNVENDGWMNDPEDW